MSVDTSGLFSRNKLSVGHPELFSLREYPLERVVNEVGKLVSTLGTLLNDPVRQTPNNLQALECLNNSKAAIEHLRDEHEQGTSPRP